MDKLVAEPREESRWARTKIWCEDHKGELLTAAGAVILVGVAAVIYKQHQQIDVLSEINEELRKRPPMIENNPTMNNNTYNIELVERSTPSKPIQIIRANGSSATFNSMKEAARETEYTMNQLRLGMAGVPFDEGTTIISLKDVA